VTLVLVLLDLIVRVKWAPVTMAWHVPVLWVEDVDSRYGG